ncbi:MAG: diacylglycerol kinase family protein, partial [Ilumatobacteraceae bacterium]
MSTVGVIVNPWAGKDIRRLHAAVGHTPDTVKAGIVRRVVIAAAECGATRILLGNDASGLAARAVHRLDLPISIELLDDQPTGSRLDTVRAASRMWKEQCGAVVVLGGDGTCRDVVIGWPDVSMVAISTGTNNVFPTAVDGSSAGAAAAFVARGVAVGVDVARRAKRILVQIDDPTAGHSDDMALVEVALVDAAFAGARAVVDASAIRHVVAASATPASTGLSSVAGRLHPVDRGEPGGVYVRFGPGGRHVRMPLMPGSFATVDIAEVRPLASGEPVVVSGPGMLAFDGERDRRVGPDATITMTVDHSGPLVIDVEQTLIRA